MLPTGNTTSKGGVKMQKLRSSEDIHANSLFVIKLGKVNYRENDDHFNRIFIVLDGRKEVALFDKITSRIFNLCDGLDLEYIDPVNPSNFVHFLEIIFGYCRRLWPFK